MYVYFDVAEVIPGDDANAFGQPMDLLSLGLPVIF